MTKQIIAISAYLAAIVAANLTLAHWGASHPEIVVYNAFLFIGLDLIARDYLHDTWRGKRLVINMILLIGLGGALSCLLALWLTPDELNVQRIALASTLAFGSAAFADSVIYQLLRERTWYERANQSNIVAAAMDSIVFIWIAFGFNLPVIFGLFCAKVAGGVVWSFVLSKHADARSWSGRNKELYG